MWADLGHVLADVRLIWPAFALEVGLMLEQACRSSWVESGKRLDEVGSSVDRIGQIWPSFGRISTRGATFEHAFDIVGGALGQIRSSLGSLGGSSGTHGERLLVQPPGNSLLSATIGIGQTPRLQLPASGGPLSEPEPPRHAPDMSFGADRCRGDSAARDDATTRTAGR